MTGSRPYDPKAAARPAAGLGDDDGGGGGGHGAGGGDDVDRWCAGRACNDIGNAERLRRREGDNLLFVRGIGWHGWDGRRWSRDDGDDLVQLAAQRTAVAIGAEAKAETNRGRAAVLAKHARRSGGSGQVAAMQREARPHLTRVLGDLDAHQELFSVDNGTLEFGPVPARRDHRRGDLITRVSPVVYDPDADYPVFKEFLREFLQRWFGYCATGSIAEQVFTIFHGQGANGKSTLLDVLRHVFGDYAAVLPFASLLEDRHRRGGEPGPDIARLPGARLVTASEPELGRTFSDAQVKTLTGEGVIMTRRLREDFFEFAPQFKLTLSCNNKPNVKGQDHGIWRRILLVPFEVTIDEPDKGLPARLLGEAPGILNWIAEGARQWSEGGLMVPDKVRVATTSYRHETDPIGRFLDEWIERGDEAAGQSTNATYLYQAYRDWCAEAAVQTVSQTLFGRKLSDRGINKVKVGTYVYLHMSLTEEARDIMRRRAEESAVGSGAAL